MWCNKCDKYLDYNCALGYGDYMCNECETIYWSDVEYDDYGNEVKDEDT